MFHFESSPQLQEAIKKKQLIQIQIWEKLQEKYTDLMKNPSNTNRNLAYRLLETHFRSLMTTLGQQCGFHEWNEIRLDRCWNLISSEFLTINPYCNEIKVWSTFFSLDSFSKYHSLERIPSPVDLKKWKDQIIPFIKFTIQIGFTEAAQLQKINSALTMEHLNSIHVIYPRPENGMYNGWAFQDKRLNDLGLIGGQTYFYRPKGRIIDCLLKSQGMERNSLLNNRFKLLFSSVSFPAYQLKLEKADHSDKWVSYDIIEAPQEVMNLRSDNNSYWVFRKDTSQYLVWDIRIKTVLAFFPSVPDFIFMKAEPLLDLEEIKDRFFPWDSPVR